MKGFEFCFNLNFISLNLFSLTYSDLVHKTSEKLGCGEDFNISTDPGIDCTFPGHPAYYAIQNFSSTLQCIDKIEKSGPVIFHRDR